MTDRPPPTAAFAPPPPPAQSSSSSNQHLSSFAPPAPAPSTTHTPSAPPSAASARPQFSQSPSVDPSPSTATTTTTTVPQGAPTARARDYQPVKVAEGTAPGRRSAKACQFCRKGKARCNGLEEYPCRRCRESGVECVFEGMTVDELKKRAEAKQAEQRSNGGAVGGAGAAVPDSTLSVLEKRLKRMEAELGKLRSRVDGHDQQLAKPDGALEVRNASGERREKEEDESKTTTPESLLNGNSMETLEQEAFNLFWEMYAPLAPYVDPALDTYENLKIRSPLLLNCIVAVASRLNPNRELVDAQRAKTLGLIRETLWAERTLTLDDLKGVLVYQAWLGKGLPPGHSVGLALQLDLPKALERLLASITGPAEEATKSFEQHFPQVRVFLVLYAQDLWLSFAMGRRSLVTIDLSITSARLLLNFAALRPVDARLVAQSELVTILGVIQESYLKTERIPAHTVHLVQQANSHLEHWAATWKAYAESQDPATSRYILSSFSVLLQGGRFYVNTLSIRDVTKPEELLPEHLGLLRTALDAAVRIQGIHPAQKIAHSAEFTLVTLSTAALFLLKMIKLAPHAFSPVHAPEYPSFSTLAWTPSHLPYDALASSPDTSASPLSFSTPSIHQALEAARHSAKLLLEAPGRQKSYGQVVSAAVAKLESEMAPTPSSSNGVLGKRPHDGLDEAQRPPPPPPAPPAAFLSTTSALYTGEFFGASTPSQDLGSLWPAGDELSEATIASLVGADSFWSWTTELPGETIQPFM